MKKTTGLFFAIALLLTTVCDFSLLNAQTHGSLDETFNSIDGGFGIGTPPNDIVSDVVEQTDGKLIVVGPFLDFETASNTNRIVSRITSYNVCYTKLLRQWSSLLL